MIILQPVFISFSIAKKLHMRYFRIAPQLMIYVRVYQYCIKEIIVLMDLNMQILYALAALRNPFLNYLMLGITYIGSEAGSIIAVLIFYWCINKYDGYYLMANFLFGTASVLGLKISFKVPRPFVAHPDFQIVELARSTAGGFSFPSGHSENAAALFGSLASLTKKKAIRILCILMIPLVMFSRMYLGAHYPTDVLGGCAAGLIVVFIIHFLLRNRESDPKIIPLVFGIGGIIVLTITLITAFSPWQSSPDQEFIADSLKNLSTLSGLILACAAAAPVERKYVDFDPHAVWWAQVLKVVLGGMILLGLRAVLKAPFQAIFGSFCLGDILRYFIVGFAGICIWPMTFKWFSRLGQ